MTFAFPSMNPVIPALLAICGTSPLTANRVGLEQNRPLLAILTTKNLMDQAPVAIDNPRVFLSTLKPAEYGNGFILRLRSLSDQPESVKLSWPAGAPASLTNTDATKAAGQPVAGDIALLPYGMATLRVGIN